MANSHKKSAAEFDLQGVKVVYPGAQAAALTGIDLKIAPGEALALVGPSGSGKTTLLRLLGATLRPTTGSVSVTNQGTGDLEIVNQDVASLGPRDLRRLRATIATVHQDLALVPSLRVVTNVLAGRLGRGTSMGGLARVFLPRRAAVEEVYTLLDRVGIAGKLYERTDRLSGGQKQRVAIARALYQQPAALLADEPVSSVDPARARDTIGLLADISRERGLTLIVSLHDITLAREHFPRLIGLRNQRIAFDRPREAVSEDLLRDLFVLDPTEMLAG